MPSKEIMQQLCCELRAQIVGPRGLIIDVRCPLR
jgi:hypothetical protein